MIKFRKKIILAKIETVYGTDAVPTGAADAILTRNLTIRPMEGDTVNRDVDRPTLGNDQAIHVGTHVVVEFEVEFSGSGTVDIPPRYGSLLRSCAMKQTINALVDVQYDLVSSNEESATIHVFFDGQRHPIVGVRGSVAIKTDPKGLPYYKFILTGLWADPSSVPDPVPDYSGFQAPLAVTNDNTPTLTLHGASYNMHAFGLDQKNDVIYRNVVGDESVQIVDRKPEGNITIDAPVLSTKNFFTTVKANTLGALQVVHGTAVGGIVQIDSSQVQLLKPEYGDADGIRTLAMGLSFIPSSAGDDDFRITTK